MMTRIRAREVAEITGLSLRMVQSRAKAGDIPGAALILGVWTFDQQTVQRWVAQAEESACRPKMPRTHSTPSTRNRGATSGISARWSTDKAIDAAYERSFKL